MRKNYKKLVTAVAIMFMGASLLSACSGNAKKALGLNKQAPDEFTVVAKAPLVLPPDYNLVPPNEMYTTASDVRPQSKPKDILFKETKAASATPADKTKKSEKYDKTTDKFLAMAGATGNNAAIRKTINKKTNELIEEKQDVVDKIMFWNDTVIDPTAVTVDAAAERKRLQDNNESGKSATDGKTPTVKAPERSLF